MIGHCVNVRDLGKLAFFSLRSQTSSLQVVCTSSSVIDGLRAIDEYALVEVTGIIQEKHRRRQQDLIEHELHAVTLVRVGFDAMRSAGGADAPSDAQEIFKSIEPAVRDAQLIEGARRVLSERRIIELSSPDKLPFFDLQALACLAYDDGPTARERRYCLHPPFHAYSRFLAAGGLHRFAFFSSAISGCRLLHVAVCRPNADELRAIFHELAGAIFGGGADSQPLNCWWPGTATHPPARQSGVGRQENEHSQPDWPDDVHAVLDLKRALTVRDWQVTTGLGLAERQILYRKGAAIGHCCVVHQDFGAATEAALALGTAPHAVAAWLRLFRDRVVQPIPRMAMLTLMVNGREGVVGTRARARDRARSTEAAFELSTDLMDGECFRRTRAAHVAQLAEAEQLRVEIEILRGHATEVEEVTSAVALELALQIIESVLPAYNLPLNLVHRLLNTCQRIHPEWRVERPVNLFQMLWTLLGNASVKSLLDSSEVAIGVMEQLIEDRIISDKRQLLYLYPAALPALGTLLGSCADDERAALVVQLRTLMAQRPTLFATAAQTAAASWATRDETAHRLFDNLLRCAELGIATPLLMRLTSSLFGDPERLSELPRALRKTGETVFRNEELQLSAVAAAFFDACLPDLAESSRKAGLSVSPELGREILYYLYRPVTMDYAMFCDALCQLGDRTGDWASWGIVGHGEFWNGTLGCYEYWLDRGVGQIGKVRLYVSKNVGSFFAKSTAGICTDINVELFNRADHYHLNIVDATDGRAAGNVQLYIGQGVGGRFLMVRGINPIQGYCINGGVDELVRCVLHAICDMAVFGEFSEVRLCEQNGLWNSDSSRAEVRACLKRLCAEMPLRPMERKFQLYEYYGRALTVSGYYRIWEAGSERPVLPNTTDRTTG
ncbi:hypothetical protein HFK91_25415 [Ralstonia pseudosolanacearum]|nr:hypothetical protein [Ralstonia pseudosolanacearum]